MPRLKQLENKNAKLKKLVADLSLAREMLQDVIRLKLGGLSGGANWSGGQWNVSIRHACYLLEMDTST